MKLGIDNIKALKKEILELIADGKLIFADGKFEIIGDAPAILAAGVDVWDISKVAPDALAEAQDLDREELMEIGQMVVDSIPGLLDLFKKKPVA